MMNAFTPCVSCHCLVKSMDSACPFCGQPVAQRAGRAHRTHPPHPPRASRAMWLAFGSSVAAMSGLACTATLPASTGSVGSAADLDPTQDSGELDGGGMDASVVDASVVDASGAEADSTITDPDLACAAGTGCACTPCGASVCDTVKEYCEHQYVENCGVASDYYVCAPRTSELGRSCLGSCTQDSCGRVVLVERFVGCGGCYGAPPARLERWREPGDPVASS